MRLGESWGQPVLVACVGPGAADDGLRELLSVGVDRVLRIDGDGTECSQDVADRLAVVLADDAAALLVVCGDLSADRGSGSVPAFLAGRLGVAQALGLVDVESIDRWPGARLGRTGSCAWCVGSTAGVASA